nr:DUF1223 domain-containing protein [Granulicella aggregans]
MVGSLILAVVAACTPCQAQEQAKPARPAAEHPTAVLLVLFTSEGCSDCPPADQLLSQVNGRKSVDGQLIVGISEHVSYWNHLAWKDPFSSDLYTGRQNDYGSHFALDSVYTTQMVVVRREQFFGSDGRALQAALKTELERKQILLRIDSAELRDKSVIFIYTASDIPAKG